MHRAVLLLAMGLALALADGAFARVSCAPDGKRAAFHVLTGDGASALFDRLPQAAQTPPAML